MISPELLREVIDRNCLYKNMSYTVYPPQIKALARALSEGVALERAQARPEGQTPASGHDSRLDGLTELLLTVESVAALLESRAKQEFPGDPNTVMREAALRLRNSKNLFMTT